MRRSDVIPALLMLALSAAIFVDTLPLEFYGEIAPGPAFLPVWLAIGGGVLVALRLLEARRLTGSAIEWPDREALQRIGLIVTGLVAVPLVSPLLGMIATVVLFMAFLLLAVLRQPVGASLATIVITGGLVYGIFVRWLGVALPTGVLGI